MENKNLVNALKDYENLGFAKLKVYEEEEFDFLYDFSTNWIKNIVYDGSGKNPEVLKSDLSQYHLWWEKLGVQHDGLFGARNRYIDPEGKLKELLHKPIIFEFLSALNPAGFTQWADPGLGWFGFRFVRPSMGDGYPTSCKNWGAAAGVVSVWLPIIGFGPPETIALVPSSHKKTYKSYLPENQKFTAGELRLAESIDESSYVRPTLAKGEILIFHPATLHTEDVKVGNTTRLNLEYRFNPKKP